MSMSVRETIKYWQLGQSTNLLNTTTSSSTSILVSDVHRNNSLLLRNVSGRGLATVLRVAAARTLLRITTGTNGRVASADMYYIRNILILEDLQL